MNRSQLPMLRQDGDDVVEHDHAWRKCRRPDDGNEQCYCCDLCDSEYPPA